MASCHDMRKGEVYVCEDCGEAFEIRASISAYSEGLNPTCTACESTKVARTFESVTVLTSSRSGTASGSSCPSSGRCPPGCSC